MKDIVDDRYRIEQQLAVGGFGTIYRATDLVIGREVALKILHRELAHDASIVARFRREIAALAKLHSPNTLTIYDVGEVDDTLYFVMELLRGETLHDVLAQSGPLPWRRMTRIARGICNSLREAHALGIVHRDLKPANVVLEQHALDRDCVKVLDFGIAKVLQTSELADQDLTRHGQMIGTFDYMAPEQWLGEPCSPASDVFTLGVLIYEMITGVRPYRAGGNPQQMLLALMTDTPAPLTGVPFELARSVMKCLSRDPHERPSVEQLDAVFGRVLEGDDDDTDEPTLIVAGPPRPSRPSLPSEPRARITRPRGSVGLETHAVHDTAPHMMAVAPTIDVQPSLARGSEREIADAIAEVLSPAPPERSVRALVRPPSVAVRFSPTPTLPVPQPRGRMAHGTSPVTDEREPDTSVALRPAPEPRGLVRYGLFAACLFGAGFLGAIALWT